MGAYYSRHRDWTQLQFRSSRIISFTPVYLFYFRMSKWPPLSDQWCEYFDDNHIPQFYVILYPDQVNEFQVQHKMWCSRSNETFLKQNNHFDFFDKAQTVHSPNIILLRCCLLKCYRWWEILHHQSQGHSLWDRSSFFGNPCCCLIVNMNYIVCW